MRKLKFIKPEMVTAAFRWEDDVFRIVDICYRRGYEISTNDARAAWEEYSDSLAGCWLTLSNSDEDVFQEVIRFCKEEE